MYQKGLGLLDLAMCVDIEIGEGLVWEKARKMQQKMSKTRSHVESRIIEITNILAPPPPPPISQEERRSSRIETPAQSNEAATQEEGSNSKATCPPSNEAARGQETTLAPPPYTEKDPGKMKRSETSDSVGSSEQGEILFSMSGVQVFHVSATGEVTTPSFPQTLHLVKFNREGRVGEEQLPPAFLEA